MDILLVFACFYMAYSNAAGLIKTPLNQWAAPQYAMLFVTVLLIAVGALKAFQVYKKRKEINAKASEEALVLQAKDAQEKQNLAPPCLDDWEEKTANFNYTLAEKDD